MRHNFLNGFPVTMLSPYLRFSFNPLKPFEFFEGFG